jgi:hypothetical protein
MAIEAWGVVVRTEGQGGRGGGRGERVSVCGSGRELLLECQSVR